jgi:hypothetical protein
LRYQPQATAGCLAFSFVARETASEDLHPVAAKHFVNTGGESRGLRRRRGGRPRAAWSLRRAQMRVFHASVLPSALASPAGQPHRTRISAPFRLRRRLAVDPTLGHYGFSSTDTPWPLAAGRPTNQPPPSRRVEPQQHPRPRESTRPTHVASETTSAEKWDTTGATSRRARRESLHHAPDFSAPKTLGRAMRQYGFAIRIANSANRTKAELHFGTRG